MVLSLPHLAICATYLSSSSLTTRIGHPATGRYSVEETSPGGAVVPAYVFEYLKGKEGPACARRLPILLLITSCCTMVLSRRHLAVFDAHINMSPLATSTGRAATRRAITADPNKGRCSIKNCSEGGAIIPVYVFEPFKCYEEGKLFYALEYIWGRGRGELTLDTAKVLYIHIPPPPRRGGHLHNPPVQRSKDGNSQSCSLGLHSQTPCSHRTPRLHINTMMSFYNKWLSRTELPLWNINGVHQTVFKGAAECEDGTPRRRNRPLLDSRRYNMAERLDTDEDEGDWEIRPPQVVARTARGGMMSVDGVRDYENLDDAGDAGKEITSVERFRLARDETLGSMRCTAERVLQWAARLH
ncbi:hypothetical protein CVT24_010694 [Panaeolus cyanescens]|uniref:Uncharacterized protein n=1 Tax=Panaeolus cyanescens TaxID=181874 RepID=A0A409YNH4_9AGAR|nr:hypothetical protein CVT24_010694 [Panaeolus cyanescens]